MLKNHNFDLAHALSKKNSAVWRYKEHYQNNAEGCKECSLLWKQLEEDDNKHIAMLVAEIKKHITEGRFE